MTLKILIEMIELTKIVYNTTQLFPKTELYNLTSQIQRAIISVRLNSEYLAFKTSYYYVFNMLNKLIISKSHSTQETS